MYTLPEDKILLYFRIRFYFISYCIVFILKVYPIVHYFYFFPQGIHSMPIGKYCIIYFLLLKVCPIGNICIVLFFFILKVYIVCLSVKYLLFNLSFLKVYYRMPIVLLFSLFLFILKVYPIVQYYCILLTSRYTIVSYGCT